MNFHICERTQFERASERARMCGPATAARELAAALEVANGYLGASLFLWLFVMAVLAAACVPVIGARLLYVYAYEQGRAASPRAIAPLVESVRDGDVEAAEARRAAMVVRDLEQSHRAHTRLARGLRTLFSVVDAVLDAEMPRGTAARRRADALIERDGTPFVRLYERSNALLTTLNGRSK